MTIEVNALKSAEKLMFIDGQFTPDDASELLVHLLDAQINFYQIKALRSYVNLGKEDEHARQQIAALRKTMEKIQAMVSESKLLNRGLIVKADIQVRVNGHETSGHVLENN